MTNTNSKTKSVIKKLDNGNLEITYTLPIKLVKDAKDDVLKKLGLNLEISGFRKGMAPLSKVEEKVQKETLVEEILKIILPEAFADSVNTHKITPLIYPKFELISTDQEKDWEVRAITCELPQIDLNNYKSKISANLSPSKIIVPGKNQEAEEDKDEKAVKAILKSIDVQIPKILIDEEVNGRLSSLLSRIEKLGLSLEGYLKTLNKTPEILRGEYEKQSEDAIKIELILNEIANKEKIEISDAEVEDFIKSTGSEVKSVDTKQKEAVSRVLRRRKALEIIAKI